MRDEQKLQVIGNWLADLVDLTKGGVEPPTRHKIALYTEQLHDMFPAAAFTKASLRATIFEQDYFPSLNHVRASVRLWWHENMPATGAYIAFDSGETLSPMDQRWVDFYFRRRGELRQLGGDPLADHTDASERIKSALGNLESLIQAQSPKAWSNITGVRTVRPADATPEAMEHVRRVVRGMTGRDWEEQRHAAE